MIPAMATGSRSGTFRGNNFPELQTNAGIRQSGCPQGPRGFLVLGPVSGVADLLPSQMNPVELDLDRVLTAGESAGGLLSVSSALAHLDEMRACAAAYPNVNMGAEHFWTRKLEPLMGTPVAESVTW